MRPDDVWVRPERTAAELRDLGVEPAGVSRIRDRIAGQIHEGRHPGAEYALYRNGSLVVEMGAGTARRSGDVPVTPDSLFTLLSCTKPWSAVAAHILIERGAVDLDRPVAEYWPEFAKNGKEAVTVDHLLSHRAGIPHVADHMDLSRDPFQPIVDATPLWPPGERNAYHYSVFGWTIWAIVERVDGRPLPRFIREEVFDRIGMADSHLAPGPDRTDVLDRIAYIYPMEPNSPGETFTYSATPADPSVPEYGFVWNRPEAHRSGEPSGAGIAPARDMARFYGMLANGGEIDGVRILERQSIERATARSNAPGEEDMALRGPVIWSRGFHLGGENAPMAAWTTPRTFGHAGGRCSLAWAEPERNVGFAYLTNGNLAGDRRPREAELSGLTLEACP